MSYIFSNNFDKEINLYNNTQQNTIQQNTIQQNTIQQNTVQQNTVQQNTVQKNIIFNSNIVNNNLLSINDIIVHTFMYRNFFIKLSESVNKTISFHNQSKEYYYIFHFPYTSYKRRYSGKYIKKMLSIPYNNITRLDFIDKLYYIYYLHHKFFMNIINSFDSAKKNYNKVKEYYISISPPKDIYGEIQPKTLSSKEILYLYNYANKLFKKPMLIIPKLLQ